MKAVVGKVFDGASDGTIYPKKFNVGDTVEGDLARVAVEQGWAIEEEMLPADSAPAVAIPGDWGALNAHDSIVLARALGAVDSIKTKAAAADFIKAEIDKRAKAAETQD